MNRGFTKAQKVYTFSLLLYAVRVILWKISIPNQACISRYTFHSSLFFSTSAEDVHLYVLMCVMIFEVYAAIVVSLRSGNVSS